MRPFHIARRTERRERVDRYLPWCLAPVFAVGLIASKVWPLSEPVLRLAFYAGCIALGAYVVLTLVFVTRQPVNYTCLRLSDGGIEYQALSPAVFTVGWDEIDSVVFCREEALFPDPGLYLETKWLVNKQDGKILEVVDELGSRRPLLRAFRECLPEFDLAEARRGMRSGKAKGKWLCFQRKAGQSL